MRDGSKVGGEGHRGEDLEADVRGAMMLAVSPVPSLLSHGCTMASASGQQQLMRRTKQEICSAFIARLRERRSLDVTPEVIEGIKQHFASLPTRYALDVNISSLDILNHHRLLQSARNDPAAVSFQVRSVDVGLVPTYSSSGSDRRPSFGGLDTLLSEVRPFIRKHIVSYVASIFLCGRCLNWVRARAALVSPGGGEISFQAQCSAPAGVWQLSKPAGIKRLHWPAFACCGCLPLSSRSVRALEHCKMKVCAWAGSCTRSRGEA